MSQGPIQKARSATVGHQQTPAPKDRGKTMAVVTVGLIALVIIATVLGGKLFAPHIFTLSWVVIGLIIATDVLGLLVAEAWMLFNKRANKISVSIIGAAVVAIAWAIFLTQNHPWAVIGSEVIVLLALSSLAWIAWIYQPKTASLSRKEIALRVACISVGAIVGIWLLAGAIWLYQNWSTVWSFATNWATMNWPLILSYSLNVVLVGVVYIVIRRVEHLEARFNRMELQRNGQSENEFFFDDANPYTRAVSKANSISQADLDLLEKRITEAVGKAMDEDVPFTENFIREEIQRQLQQNK